MKNNNVIENLHNHSKCNSEEIKRSKMCGCFYCLSVFKSEEVVTFLEKEKTALCPKCGVDSVIGDGCGCVISKSLLEQMNKEWF